MTQEQAFQIVAQACGLAQMNLESHKAVQQALQVLRPKPPAKEEKKDA